METDITGASPSSELCSLCLAEATAALSASRLLGWLPRHALSRRLAGPAERFAARLSAFDRAIERDGLASAAETMRAGWSDPPQVVGAHHLPARGPLLVAANHPGLVDALVLLSRLRGHDIRIVVGERPLFAALPALRPYLLSVGTDAAHNARTWRAAAAHLRRGGTLVMFPAGRIEPDPMHYPVAARAALAAWSRGAALLAGRVRTACLLPCVIGGVIVPAAGRHPMVRWSGDRVTRDWLAATRQALQPTRFVSSPRLAFAPVTDVAPVASAQTALLARIRALQVGMVVTDRRA